MKIYKLEPVFVEQMPDEFIDGKLYISKKYGIAVHNCACGCKGYTSTNLNSPDMETSWTSGWKYEEKDGKVSLHPSLGNWNFPCKSHYFIKENEIKWC